jgi:predicted nucleic acid-binding protein
VSVAVFDANVIVKWYIAADPFFDQALAAQQAYQGAAPELVQSEVANALWKYVRAGIVKLEDACEGVAVLSELIDLTPDNQLLGRAQRLSAQLDHPVYDCLYLALAQTLACPLVTADKRLAEKAGALDITIDFIGSKS